MLNSVCSVKFTSFFLNFPSKSVAIKKNVHGLPANDAESVQSARRLYVRLRTLFNSAPNTRFLDVFLVLYLLMNMVLSVYMSYAFSQAGESQTALMELNGSCFMGVLLYVINNEAHIASERMIGPVIAALDKMSLDASDPPCLRAVTLFYLTVTSWPARISLSGFTSLGRSLFTSVRVACFWLSDSEALAVFGRTKN
ncbi:uncharacterized protein LOC117649135 [Thrips palmi]|uniref:Uncharacterized protein LOC117649135 n=1 Tax=Thrips palmi TaxID=161013 RepID=A0A6P8ZDF7_THRPL|nr:uncharacterized protein LOC117649135 [Thrips palmi]